MPHRLLKVLLTAGLCTALLPAVALAKDHGKGHDRDDDDRKRFTHHDNDRDKDHDRDHDKDRDHDRDKRPPGWSKGKKTGWGNCNLPPGQAKKQGCHGDGDHDRDDRKVHHRDGDHDRDDHKRRAGDGDHDRDDHRRKLPPASGSTTANAGASNGPHSRWVLNQNNNKK